MRSTLFCGVLTAILVLSGGLVAQHTWTVDLLNRPGTDFTDLPAAVAGAAPGDVLRVRYVDPALQLFYVLPTVRRGISIVGETPRPICHDVLQVLGVPAGETVLVSNLRIGTVEPTLGPHSPVRGVAAQNNLGSVLFDRIEYGFLLGFGATDPRGFLVDNCALVTLAHCQLYQCGSNITFRNSNVVATNTSFVPVTSQFIWGTPLVCERARVWLTDCEVRGADRTVYSYEAPAISTCYSYFWLSGTTVVLPGWPSFSADSFGYPTTISCGGTTWYSEVRMSPGVQIDNVPSTFLTIVAPVPGITWNIAQSQLTLQTEGYPSSPAILAATIDPSPQSTNPLGHLFLDPGLAAPLAVTTTDVQGNSNLRFPIPPGLPPDMRMTVQGLQLTPSLTLELTNVTVVSTW